MACSPVRLITGAATPGARPSIPCTEAAGGNGPLPGATGRLTYLCDGKLFTLDLASGSRRLLLAHPDGITSFAWQPGGKLLAYTTTSPTAYDWAVHLWDPVTGESRRLFTEINEAVSAGWFPDGSVLQVSEYISGFRLIDPRTGRTLVRGSGRGQIRSPVQRRFALFDGPIAYARGDSASSAYVYDLHGDTAIRRLIGRGDPGHACVVRCFAADGTLLYEEYDPGNRDTVTWWALPPAPDAEPVRLAPDSPLVREYHAAAVEPAVHGSRISAPLRSPDGRWVLFSYIGAGAPASSFLLPADRKGQPVPVGPGPIAAWDPRP